jgi:RND family efflux transporter MFP subunit
VLSRVAPAQVEKAKAPGEKNATAAGPRGPNGPSVVVVAAAGQGKVNDQLKAIGDGDAIRSVTVTPLVPGQIASLKVIPGMRVSKGDVVAVLDSEAEAIALEKAQVSLTSAQDKLSRNQDLKKIISRAELQDAQSAVDTARLAVAEAEFNLRRRTILSPVSGIAGIVNFSEGDYVTVSSALVTIDDRSRLLVDFWVPERFTSLVAENTAVSAIAIARPGKVYSGKVVAVDNRIDAASRTLHVQAEIENSSDELRAGQSFEVTLNLAGDSWPSVEPLSVQWDSQGSYVWRVADHKVERVGVTIIERNPESVLVDGALKPGDQIVVEGLQRLRPGAEVRLFGEKPPENKAGSDKTAGAL